MKNRPKQSVVGILKNKCRSLVVNAKSMLMRDVFAALLRYGEFASQFHLRPLAIPRLESYTVLHGQAEATQHIRDAIAAE